MGTFQNFKKKKSYVKTVTLKWHCQTDSSKWARKKKKQLSLNEVFPSNVGII